MSVNNNQSKHLVNNVLLASLLTMLSPQISYAEWGFEGLPAPGSPPTNRATSISVDGSVIGGQLYQQLYWYDGPFAAYWTPTTGWQGLEEYGSQNQNWNSRVANMTDDGSVAVGESEWDFGTDSATWVISGSPSIPNCLIDYNPTGSKYTYTRHIDISADAAIIVGVGQTEVAQTIYGSAAKCTASGISFFADVRFLEEPLYGGYNSTANAVSGDGMVVVGKEDGNYNGFSWGSIGAFRWSDTEFLPLGDFSGGGDPIPQDTNWDGSVIVGHGPTAATQLIDPLLEDAFVWTSANGITALPRLVGAMGARAEAVSGDGSVIVGHSLMPSVISGNYEKVATIWTGNTAGEIKQVLSSQGRDMTGWVLTNATAVSRNGEFIVGDGLNPAGIEEAWRVRITAEVDVDNDFYSPPADCNDNDASVNPGAIEIANDGIDQNCDGIDLIDVDLDGFDIAQDCNDNDASIYPGATEVPYDGIDQNCDGVDLVDVDLDGFDYPLDCDDNDAGTNPGASEIKHDGIDQDCNGYDLTIDITKAAAKGKNSYTLNVVATSSLGASAALTVDGYGAMDYNSRKNLWKLTVRKIPTAPAQVTVTGVEGSETVTIN